MDTIQELLITQAKQLHAKIYPCGKKKDLRDCFTIEAGELYFWYNTEDNQTHLLSAYLQFH